MNIGTGIRCPPSSSPAWVISQGFWCSLTQSEAKPKLGTLREAMQGDLRVPSAFIPWCPRASSTCSGLSLPFALICSKAQSCGDFCRTSRNAPKNMCHHLVNTQCFQTYLLAIPEVFRHSLAASVAGRVIHNVIAPADRAVGLLQAAALGVAGCCQV